jgi:serine protease Do
MNRKMIPAALLAICICVTAPAQTKEKTTKEESITIRKKGESKEKTTIVIDGDNITVNGKPLEEMKDSDIEVFRNKDFSALIPKLRGRMAPGSSMKMFGDDFPFGGNSAFLGVVSEKTENGAKITSIENESAAEKAGLKKDDIITKVGDSKIEGSDDLYEAIGKYKPEQTVSISYLRNGKEATATATLSKRNSSAPRVFKFNGGDFNFDMPVMPKMNGMNFDFNRKPRLGMEIQDLAEGKGVKILEVGSESAAARAGLQKDDVVTEVDGKSVASVDELKAKVKELKEGDSVKLTYKRNGKVQTADIKFPKKLKTADL